MPNSIIGTIIFIWLLCTAKSAFLLVGARKNIVDKSSTYDAAADGGTCKSRVQIYGYSCEDHTVTTEDGYILSLQRISTGRSGEPAAESIRTPVLLQHGINMDGATWVLNSPEQSLGFILADIGFDVWLANARGTIPSSKHTTLSSSDPAYWDWSWDELAAKDLPTNVEYVYSQTGNNKIHYVGHSLGTLVALASFSQHNLVNMVRSAALLSPIAYMDRLPSPLAHDAAITFGLEAPFWLAMPKFDPASPAVRNLLSKLCSISGTNCFSYMDAITGSNCCLNSSSANVFFAHELQPTSSRNMIHLSQMISTGTIKKYDYLNIFDNMRHYGQGTPPAYTMSNIPNDLPLLLSYGARDFLSDPEDVRHLLDSLKSHNPDMLTVQYIKDYAHMDFIMAVNAKQVVYDPLIAFYKLH